MAGLLACSAAVAAVPAVAAASDALTASGVAAAPAVVLDSRHDSVPLAQNARYIVDPLQHASPEAIEPLGDRAPWKRWLPDQALRIDHQALWVQFDAQVAGKERWFLEVGSSGVDRVQFFYRNTDGRWVMQEAGDARTVSDWPVPGRLPTFELAGPAGKPVRYWLRVEHDRLDFASPLRLYPERALLSSRESEQFLMGGYFALSALIALASLANALAFRDRNFGTFALYVATSAVGQLAYLGIGAQYVWDRWLRWNEMAGFVLPGLSAAAALWFARTLTEPSRYSRAMDLSVWGLIAALLSSVALEAALNARGTFFLVVLFSTASLVAAAALILFVWKQGDDPHMHLFALGFLPMLVFAISPVARAFNLVPVGPMTRYGITLGAALQMPVLFYALSVRGNRRRESQVRAAALSRTDALTGLAHTQTFLARLESTLARCTAQKHACALLAVKIANFDALVEEFGQDMADRALVVAASLLRNAISDIDMAARVGHEEFALLLEGPFTAAEAMSRAQQIVASGLRPSEGLPSAMILKFLVSVAMLPERQFGAEASLQWALQTAGGMGTDARKLIRAMNF